MAGTGDRQLDAGQPCPATGPCGLALLIVLGVLLPSQAVGQTASSFWRTSLADEDIRSPDSSTGDPALDRATIDPQPAEARLPATPEPRDGVEAEALNVPRPRPEGAVREAEPDRRRPAPAAPSAGVRAARPVSSDHGSGARSTADPFAAPGIRLGTLRVTPQFGLFGGVRLLPTAGAQEDARSNIVDIAPQVDVTTDWSRHAVELSARWRARLAKDVPVDRNYDFDARLRGRLDIADDTTLTLEAGARGRAGETLVTALPGGVGPQGGLAAPGTGVTQGIVGTVAPPLALRERDEELTAAGSVALSRRIGRVALTGAGEVERTRRAGEDPATTYRLRGRAALDGGFASPFVEITGARTRFCDPCGGDFDAAGALVGLSFAQDRRLSGEVALGYERRREVDDDDVETGAIWRGSLSYELTPLTTLDLGTEATLGDEEDGASRTVTAGLTYLPRRWLTLTGGVAVTWEDFETLTGPTATGGEPATLTGTTRALTASLGAEYRLNRNAAIAADATQQRYTDGVTGEESVENTFRLGVVLRR